MSTESDIAKVIEQERGLVFEQFNEDVAFALGSHIRDGGKALGKGIATAVHLWDRILFYATTAGATTSNTHWIERKVNTARLLLKSTYRVVLERGDQPRVFEERWGLETNRYAIAGGAFPITVRGGGMIGVAVVSGLDERSDHNLAVEGVCRVLGVDPAAWALPPK